MDTFILWIIIISLGIFIFWVLKFMLAFILIIAWVFHEAVKRFFKKFRRKK